MTSIEPPVFMPDPRFFVTAPAIAVIDAVRVGEADVASSASTAQSTVSHVAPFDAAGAGSVTFAESKKVLADLPPRMASDGAPALIFVPPALEAMTKDAMPATCVATAANPKAAFAAVARALHRSRRPEGSDTPAEIHKTAHIDPTAVIQAGALIGADAYIGPYAVIGCGVIIGQGTEVGAHTSISHAIIGRHCRFSAGVRIGEPGFGYVGHGGAAQTIPQLARVLIGDHVDLGANTTVDRGALSDTMIGDGTKVDNLVQIAHNCEIGRHVLIAAQTGVSGSCKIGDGVMIGGQAGMADHLTIGAGAVITAKAGLMHDVPDGERWGGVPAKPAREWMKEVAAVSRLTRKDTSR